MRLAKWIILSGALLVVTRPASAQNECAAYSGDVGNVCNAAVDGTRLFHPVVGLLVSGGNPVIGTGKTLGGLPHFAITARVNAVKVQLPDLNYDGSTSTVPLDQDIFAPAPLVEGALGIWKGMPGGLLAIDLLASAQLLPTDQVDNLMVDPDATSIGSIALGLGYGARIGILGGSFPVPAVSVSIMRRGIPDIQYGDITDPTQDYQYRVNLHATNLRAVASTRLLIVNVAGGLGWDKYTGDATIAFRDPLTMLPQPPINFDLDNSRTMAFLDATLDFPVVKIAGEVGYQWGKDQKLSTTFEGINPKDGKLFAGLGVRIGF